MTTIMTARCRGRFDRFWIQIAVAALVMTFGYGWRGLLWNWTLYVHCGIQGTTGEPELMAVSTIRREN